MGACSFTVTGSGTTARKAFELLVEDARYMHGHGGYTGTIAEKDSFRVISCPSDRDPTAFVEDLFEDGDERVDDKWGPASCIQLEAPSEGKPGKWLFFGLASS